MSLLFNAIPEINDIFFPCWHIPNKGDVEMVIRESLRVEEPDFYQGQILQTHAKKKKMHQCARGLYKC